ncbi:hypothetical protein HNV10_11545 [Winogradskyella litoriviva]|uniref:Type II secretion system protein GspG C-terminal domain-containing protein n=1 Tax=Winogradskyella litoriviva TaxID=1220182 RepID=A0ABX2E5V5_9FLAO|nr:hypothetical protein [Winogradskyella litoriviva]NRD23881.1 hypothetical protein [Winogradskyella litoriviva]
MLNIIAELLLCREDYKFRKRKQARRQFEKENNLPKKIMIHPVWALFGIIVIIIVLLKFIIGFFFFSDVGDKKTLEKMEAIELILEKEKADIGSYPNELKTIIRNNPLRKDITIDFWGNEFFYKLKENEQDYILISKGKDGILKTEDDVKK